MPPSDDLAIGVGGIATLEAALGHRFRDPALLGRALTHASYAHEHAPTPHNETLAFLGDAVLGLVVAELLCARAPEAGVGSLTAERALLVSAKNLASWAMRLDLPARLRLGRGEALGGGAAKESILATAFEAVIGALYLEAGLGAVAGVVSRLATGVEDPEMAETARNVEGGPGSC